MRNEVLDFWFESSSRRHWFDGSKAFDQEVRNRLLGRYHDAAEGRLAHWCQSSDDALALCILLDQVPRNIFRGTARSFATDPQARAVARQILAEGFDRALPTDDHRMFCYLPFEHSEDVADQVLSVQLFTDRISDAHDREYAHQHLDGSDP
jgi:uncharacterized protein (DUF924 family)